MLPLIASPGAGVRYAHALRQRWRFWYGEVCRSFAPQA
jgi:hypothetical protein